MVLLPGPSRSRWKERSVAPIPGHMTGVQVPSPRTMSRSGPQSSRPITRVPRACSTTHPFRVFGSDSSARGSCPDPRASLRRLQLGCKIFNSVVTALAFPRSWHLLSRFGLTPGTLPSRVLTSTSAGADTAARPEPNVPADPSGVPRRPSQRRLRPISHQM